MDPITQGALGAAAALSLRLKPRASNDDVAIVTTAGMIGGMAPDLDVLIRSSSDPLLAVEFHRHFTHSLFFIPAGGLIVGLFLMAILFLKRRQNFWRSSVFWAATIGYATHGLLDACTSYGTQLFWPFSNFRVAWNNVGIIDPVPTALWLGAMVLAFRLRNAVRPVTFVRALSVMGLVYLLLGVVQRERASALQTQLISSRGIELETISRRVVKPTLFQLFLWRSIYQYDGKFFVDGIHLGLTGHRFYNGESIAVLSLDNRKTENRPESKLDSDLQRFAWFSDGWLAAMPTTADGRSRIGDMRYALLPHEIRPLWGIEFESASPDQPVEFKNFRDVREGDTDCYFQMILGASCE